MGVPRIERSASLEIAVRADYVKHQELYARFVHGDSTLPDIARHGADYVQAVIWRWLDHDSVSAEEIRTAESLCGQGRDWRRSHRDDDLLAEHRPHRLALLRQLRAALAAAPELVIATPAAIAAAVRQRRDWEEWHALPHICDWPITVRARFWSLVTDTGNDVDAVMRALDDVAGTFPDLRDWDRIGRNEFGAICAENTFITSENLLTDGLEMEAGGRSEFSVMTALPFDTLGSRMRRRREELELSLTDVARAADVKVGRMSEYEHDKRDPELSTIRRIAKALDMRVGELVGDDE